METIKAVDAREALNRFETFGLSYVDGGGCLLVRIGRKFHLGYGLGQAPLTEAELAEALARTIEIRGDIDGVRHQLQVIR